MRGSGLDMKGLRRGHGRPRAIASLRIRVRSRKYWIAPDTAFYGLFDMLGDVAGSECKMEEALGSWKLREA